MKKSAINFESLLETLESSATSNCSGFDLTLEQLFERARQTHLAMACLLTSRKWHKTAYGPLFHDLASNIEYWRYDRLACETNRLISAAIRELPPIDIPDYIKERSADAVKR